MSINNPDRVYHYVNLTTPCGGGNIHLTESQIADYKADPDAFAAHQFGLTRAEYYEWIETDGTPLCPAPTATGELCGNPNGGGRLQQLEAEEWKARHRHAYCSIHSEQAAKAAEMAARASNVVPLLRPRSNQDFNAPDAA